MSIDMESSEGAEYNEAKKVHEEKILSLEKAYRDSEYSQIK
jgi:hypothetical protein